MSCLNKIVSKIVLNCFKIVSTTCSNLTDVAQMATPSCSQPEQLRTMASETVDPINWPLQLVLYSAVRREHHLHRTN